MSKLFGFFKQLLFITTGFFQSISLISVGYLLLLSVAALLAKRRKVTPQLADTLRFAILVPAHNEELLIEETLTSLQQQVYPKDRYTIYVIADNCTDRTAQIACESGATVLERQNRTQIGKGYALEYALQRIVQGNKEYDAYVMCDADTRVSSNMLVTFSQMLHQGSKVIQAYYTVANWHESKVAALRYVALALVHYLRPLGRSRLGLSCGLKGNGMCFHSSVINQLGWDTFSLVEDIEYHLNLVKAGIRVDFAPDVSVEAIMPTTFRQSTGQNKRWEVGRLQMAIKYSPRLLLDGIRQKNVVKMDVAIDQFIPPVATLGSSSIISLLLGVLIGKRFLRSGGMLGTLGLGFYLATGLWLVRAPHQIYRALLLAPLYIAWKTWLYLSALLKPRLERWERTPRK